MNKNLFLILGGVVLILMGVFFFINQSQKPTSTQTSILPQEKKIQNLKDLFGKEIDVCQIFPQKEIEKMSGKKFSQTKNLFVPGSNFTEYHCTYYLDPQNALVIRVRQGNLEKIRQGNEVLGWKRKKDPRIGWEHFLAYDVKNKLRQTEFIIDQDKDIELDLWGVGGPVMEEEEAIQFSINFANYLKENFSS